MFLWKPCLGQGFRGWDGSCSNMPYSQSGRVARACWPRLAPALTCLLSIRQVLISLLGWSGSCPNMSYSQSGRGSSACSSKGSLKNTSKKRECRSPVRCPTTSSRPPSDPTPPDQFHEPEYQQIIYTLNLNKITSPSLTTYSLPSIPTRPFSLAAARDPSRSSTS